MTKSHLPQAVAAFAAVVTTLALFSAVISIADDDKAALVAAKSAPAALAVNTAGMPQR
jgi:hypothetical protein